MTGSVKKRNSTSRIPGGLASTLDRQLEEWDASHKALLGPTLRCASRAGGRRVVLSASDTIDEADIPDDFEIRDDEHRGYAKADQEYRALGIRWRDVKGAAIVRSGTQAWMITPGRHYRYQWSNSATRILSD